MDKNAVKVTRANRLQPPATASRKDTKRRHTADAALPSAANARRPAQTRSAVAPVTGATALRQQGMTHPAVTHQALIQQVLSQQAMSQEAATQQGAAQQGMSQHGMSQQGISQQALSQCLMSPRKFEIPDVAAAGALADTGALAALQPCPKSKKYGRSSSWAAGGSPTRVGVTQNSAASTSYSRYSSGPDSFGSKQRHRFNLCPH